jgi:hypothetical protein
MSIFRPRSSRPRHLKDPSKPIGRRKSERTSRGQMLSGLLGALGAGLLVAVVPSALGQDRASLYPERPADPLAVYLTKDAFPVHADGGGDDAVSLQQAIDQVRAAHGGGIVFIPEGTYRLDRTVYVWRGIRLIGYGHRKPRLLLAENTPGFQTGPGRYLICFAHQPGPPGGPVVDGNEGTLYSGLINFDVEIRNGNPAAIAIRAHYAQHSSLTHVDFHIGSALGAVEEAGHLVDDCRFFGGDFAIRTGITAAGWQVAVFDSEFEGQRSAAIETHEAGMTVIRCRFSRVPCAIRIPMLQVSHLTGESTDRLYVRDSRFEDIREAAIWVARYYDPKTQINVDDVECARVPVFLEFNPFVGGLSRIPAEHLKIAGVGEAYSVRMLSHGLQVKVDGAGRLTRQRDTVCECAGIPALTPIVKPDRPDLPPQSSWANVLELGARGDGATDDTAAFRRAIALNRAVYVPQGTYRISDTLTLGKDTALIGLQPAQTRLTLAPATPGFSDPDVPKAVIVAPAGSAPIVSGIGILLQNPNPGSVGIKWMAAPESFLDDVTISTSRAGTGAEERYGLWITDGGAGTFRGIWTPSESATAGLVISNTSAPGTMYQISVEHHRKVEVILRNVSNWTFYTLQTEEIAGDEQTASLEMADCRHLRFINYFMYHNSGTNTPFAYGVRVGDSEDIAFRGMHNFSGGPFPFDATVLDLDSGVRIFHPEMANLKLR